MSDRKCGDCQACCEDLPVAGVDGCGSFERCKYQDRGRCAIYEFRPSECAAFKCSYLEGMTPDEERFRPDVAGVVLETVLIPKPDGSNLTALTGMIQGTTKDIDVELFRAATESGKIVMIISLGDNKTNLIGDRGDCLYFTQFTAAVSAHGSCDIQYADKKVRVFK